MSTYSAGKVSITPRGQYSASAQYERLDVVSDNGSSYMYINKTPATGVSLSTATHWMEIAKKGATGDTGPQGEQGIQGAPGQDGSGVPAGGTTGQVLSKVDNTDHNVAWADQTGGGGGGKNLLHNWDFRNPVNQRAVTGAITTGTYFYDRWIRNSGTVTTNADYLTIGASAEIEQRIEGNLLAGETVTVSVMVGGTVYGGTGIMPTSGTASVTLTGWGTATLTHTTDFMYVRLQPTAASNVVRVKLELGTVSTLAYDPPMDYSTEFVKCLRYFVVPENRHTGSMSHATTSGNLEVLLLVPMRVIPTISQTTGLVDCVAGRINITNASIYLPASGGRKIDIVITTASAITARAPLIGIMTTPFWLSAEL